jgi:nitrite reductase (NO-forming)
MSLQGAFEPQGEPCGAAKPSTSALSTAAAAFPHWPVIREVNMAQNDEVSRRTFMEKALIATGVVASGAIAGSAYMAVRDDGSGGLEASGHADSDLPEPERAPAKTATIAEISRHPLRMPRDANYTLYRDGQYQNSAPRSGPITQEVHFTIQEGAAEVVPGATMDYWTFDGGIPGPMVRARLNDTVHFFLTNPPTNSLPHNVDFHAVNGPGGAAAHLATAPGETSEIRVKLLNPGIFIYHCAFPDIPMHISHGMYGLIVVEPEGGLPQVDHEFYMMQSEFYTDRGGRMQHIQLRDAGHLATSMEFGRLEQPTFVVFNGRPDSITGENAMGMGDQRINVGDTVRLFVGNIGPNLVSSFHVIGEIFDRVYVEGSFDLVNRNVQTTLIPAGGAAGVEFKVDYPGDYLAVDHAIFRTHKGAAAIIHVEGEADPAIYQPIRYNQSLSGGH